VTVLDAEVVGAVVFVVGALVIVAPGFTPGFLPTVVVVGAVVYLCHNK